METGKSSSDLHVQDDAFDPTHSDQYSIYLRFAHGQAQSAFVDISADKLVAVTQTITSHPQEFNPVIWINEQDWARGEYSGGSISVQPEKAMLVPAAMDDEKALEQLWEDNFGQSGAQIRKDVVKDLDLQVVYTWNDEWFAQLVQQFPYTRLKSSVAANIEAMFRGLKFTTEQRLFIERLEGRIACYAWKGEELVLYNQFKATTDNDVLYHTMNVCQQLGMDPGKDNISVMGEIVHGDDLDKLLRKYLRNVSVNYGMGRVRLADGLSSVRKQNFASIINLITCE